jgi:hypothetical protein
VLGRHPDHHLIAAGVGRDEFIAAFEAEITASEGSPLVQIGWLDDALTLLVLAPVLTLSRPPGW